MNKRFILSKEHNPNYLATICRIGEIFPIEGADKLVKTVVNGYDIVIGKDHKEGEIVVYFPVESAINEMYLSKNNLFERSEFERNANADSVKEYLVELEQADENGDTQAAEELSAKIKSMCGFFTKNGRVRILKLRGQYSQGFIAGVDSLVNYDETLKDTDWESLVGTQFNYIDDKEFCWKYIPPISGRGHQNHHGGNQSIWKKRMKKIRKFNRLVDGQFVFHYDTKMLAEHINEFKPDDNVSVTVKVHGCVEKDTIIETQEYGKITIGEIVENKKECHVKAFDTNTNEIVYTPVYDWYFLENDGEWYEIELEDGRKLCITGNNPVFLPELNCYRKVSELDGTEKLLISD